MQNFKRLVRINEIFMNSYNFFIAFQTLDAYCSLGTIRITLTVIGHFKVILSTISNINLYVP
jgi:hypothetical protein